MALAGIGADLEGIHAVEAALDAGRVTELIIERRRSDKADIERLVSKAETSGAIVSMVDDVRPLATTQAPQGVVARARPIPTVTIDEAVGSVEVPALLVLDHVEDPRNIGAAARSALATGMTALVVSHHRSAPIGATAFKASVGALEHVPVVDVSSIADAVRRLGKLDVWTVGLDGTADRSLLGLELLAEPVAVCVGAEGAGLSRLVGERCDVVAKLPMVGEAESFNASVAASLACYEVARVRGWVT